MKFIFLNKFRRFFILMFAFLLPFVAMNTFSVSESHPDLTVRTISPIEDEENISGYIEEDKASMIAQNIQRVSGLLSSTPSQLAEQAKSYALGRLNGTINSEVQEWLSQFGTAKINLSVDRKGKLHNSSLDLLFPLYDNKVDWLVFSQLGYRNKDSRNTVNLGFGSRYFISDWMYGFNTFFDQDITGKNNRLGLGAEAWADYLKLSANTYIRLSKWHQSRDDKLWEERPANGFDINGEFFLPAYPHIGSKLGYEKYFGDGVTLFNRDTKQKNPGFAKVGMTYTPIPLITMGIDYRHGTNKHSDARFQANLNYRFGVPLSVQLSPDSVASMRTLAGSRYDLVERNNTIVLDHREKPSLEISLPHTLHGDSEDKETIIATVTSNKPTKPVTWRAEETFSKNGGELPSAGNEIQIKLPKYIPNGVNSYPIYATVELENGKLSKTATMTVTVKEVKLGIKLPNTLHGYSEEEKKVTATVDSNKQTKPVTWRAEEIFSKNGGKLPSTGNEIQIKLPKYIPNGVNSYPISATVELENGKLAKTAEMTITVNPFTPGDKPFISEMEVSPKETLFGNGKDEYTYRVLIIDPENGQPLRNYKLNATWEVIVNELLRNNVYFKEQEKTTDNDGYLKALLVSKVGVDGVKVNMNITTDDGNAYASNSDKNPVNFKPVIQQAGLLIFGRHAHEYKHTYEQDKPYNVYEGLTITLVEQRPGHYPRDIARYDDDIEYAPPSSDLVKIVNKKITFPFETFSSSKTATVIATVTKAKSGAKYAYTYTFKPKRYVFSPDVGNNGKVKLGDNSINNTCDNLDLKYSKGLQAESMTEENVIEETTNSNSLGREYPYASEYPYAPLEGFSGFGFLPYQGQPKDLKVKIKSKEGAFILYHYYEQGGLISFNPGASNDFGRLLCKLKE
ncbi:inverse autotransporter beta domain-containing protein [Xenorhabdus sp. PB61.4]|uniref:inverse autotransporter beta domain-containing protein n=1 Tax=Xenorhabdus sp. PB61.4 TaxID=2788940 RepID=UPI001E590E65|nr:inverse autotransporter beta domain-containing protein [Xenorhabdus sp. PB61.4]MCC8367244.1 inverse autotransporter beta domain-containing protein [Xenorhabdus sp. PB61.4]